MRKSIALLCLFASSLLAGCNSEEAKPDPRQEPGFVDTTDPSKLMDLPADPNQAGKEDGKQDGNAKQ